LCRRPSHLFTRFERPLTHPCRERGATSPALPLALWRGVLLPTACAPVLCHPSGHPSSCLRSPILSRPRGGPEPACAWSRPDCGWNPIFVTVQNLTVEGPRPGKDRGTHSTCRVTRPGVRAVGRVRGSSVRAHQHQGTRSER
jgi:hypothetical protein